MKKPESVQTSLHQKRLVAPDPTAARDTDDMARWFEALYQSAQGERK